MPDLKAGYAELHLLKLYPTQKGVGTDFPSFRRLKTTDFWGINS